MWFFKEKITKEQAQLEIDKMIDIYNNPDTNFMMRRDSFTKRWNSGFLVGSSLCGYKQGDSARFWELKAIIDGK